MPLIRSGKKSSIGSNIATEIRAGKPRDQAAAIAYSVMRRAKEKKMAHGGHLTAEERKHIAPNNFAEPGDRKYPIEDPAHARNALVSQFGSTEEKEKVRSAVHHKYPEMGKADGGLVEEEYDKPNEKELYAEGGEVHPLDALLSEKFLHSKRMAEGGEIGMEPDPMNDEDYHNDEEEMHDEGTHADFDREGYGSAEGEDENRNDFVRKFLAMRSVRSRG